MLLLCGSALPSADPQISYRIKVTTTVSNEEATVQMQERGNETEPVITNRTTPFEITAAAGVFDGVFTRLSGAAEIQVDVYCEGCKEERILYGHGTQISTKLDGEERTFSVRK